MAGECNDVQCYAIHWVKIYEENGEWKYEVQTESVLGEDIVAGVQIEYLKPDAALKGHKANRTADL